MGRSAATNRINRAEKEKESGLKGLQNFQFGKNQANVDNPFGAVTDQSAGLTNQYDAITNDLANQRVNTQAAEFEAQRADEGQANILDAIVQGGGSSGSTATTLAQQAAQSNQRISAGLGAQEQQIGLGAAQNAQNIQQLQAQGGAQLDQFQSQSRSRVQELFGQGQQYISDVGLARDQQQQQGLSTIYQVGSNNVNIARKARADKRQNLVKNIFKGIQIGNDVVKTILGAKAKSDPRLKENIVKIGTSPSGIPIYKFDYKDGSGTYEGAMSNEVPVEAIVKNINGTEYNGVDYSMIDVELKKIK